MPQPDPPRLSPELALLAATDLAGDEALARQAAAAIEQGVDWPRFVALAAAHGMGPIAGARLAEAAPGAIPDAVAQPLREAWRESSAALLAQTIETVAVARLLAAEDIRSIVLKGVAVSHLLYALHPEWRRSDDIDLLIDRGDLDRADRLLRGRGYERTWPEGDLPTAGLDMLLHLANVFTYLSPKTGQTIELHHRIGLNPHWLAVSFEKLFARSIEIATAAGPVRGLDGPLHVAYLSAHALGHHGYRLKWFCDIVRALRRAGAESATDYVQDAVPPGLSRIMQVTDRVIVAIEGAAEALRAGFGGREAALVLADLEQAAPIPTHRSLARLPGELANLRVLLRLAPNRKARTYQMARSLCDPRDVYALGLGRRFAPLYVALGPFMAIGRLLGRGARKPAP